MLFVQDDKDSVREEEKFQRKKKKLKNSEILETLREEFGQAPEVGRQKLEVRRVWKYLTTS